MRMLLLLILIGAGAYFTMPTHETQEAAARAFLEADAQQQTSEAQAQAGISLDSVVDFVTGFVAGQGRYDNYYVASKFTVDMPGAAYVECWGAFTQVQCRRVDRGAGAA